MKKVYLLTGKPGAGKTSLIKQIVSELKGRAGGFYTEEIRSGGTRLGFKLITLEGGEATLAHVNIRSRYRVGKYGVDIDNLNQVGVPAIIEAIRRRDVIIIDEIGKMELFSNKFREAVWEAIRSGKPVLGTIMLSPNPWADELKRQPQVKLAEVSRSDFHRLLDDIKLWLPKE